MYTITQKASLINKAQSSAESTRLQFFLLSIVWVFQAFRPEWIAGLKFLAPIPTLIQLVLLLLWFMYSNKKMDSPITKYFFLFLIGMILSSIFARNNGIGRDIIRGMFFLYITYIVTITFANNAKRIFMIINIFILGQLFIAIRAIQGGGAIYGDSQYVDENIVALGMNILFPLSLFLGIGEQNRIKKIFYFVFLGISLTAIVVANSRGGFVGLIAVLLFAWLKSPINKLKTASVILIIVLAMAYFAPKSFWDDMSTLEQGTQESTASERIYFWKIAIREFLDHPIIGVGVLNFGILLPEYARPDDTLSDGRRVEGRNRAYGRVAHSIYFTVLSELGSVGVVIFCLICYWFYKDVNFNKKEIKPIITIGERQEEDAIKENLVFQSLKKCHSLSLGIMGSMIGFLMAGAFLSVIYFPQFWWLCTLGVLLGICRRKIIEDIKANERVYL